MIFFWNSLLGFSHSTWEFLHFTVPGYNSFIATWWQIWSENLLRRSTAFFPRYWHNSCPILHPQLMPLCLIGKSLLRPHLYTYSMSFYISHWDMVCGVKNSLRHSSSVHNSEISTCKLSLKYGMIQKNRCGSIQKKIMQRYVLFLWTCKMHLTSYTTLWDII